MTPICSANSDLLAAPLRLKQWGRQSTICSVCGDNGLYGQASGAIRLAVYAPKPKSFHESGLKNVCRKAWDARCGVPNSECLSRVKYEIFTKFSGLHHKCTRRPPFVGIFTNNRFIKQSLYTKAIQYRIQYRMREISFHNCRCLLSFFPLPIVNDGLP